ncbi:MAG TPA: quinone-dependent dihydroorotate dehydrogenase [Rhizobiaceae bacterium]|nr:quinone-dependent dihydroorotate dehydrogenase [Rhizobiaceae bacterium]
MSPLFNAVGRRFLFSLDPERAHGLSIRALAMGLPLVRCPGQIPELQVRVAGLSFPNPLGMAAGYDKNGEAPDALLSLGFGFVEIGTVTPLPQTGNPKPRIFRLTEQNAVINRLGFNNEGHRRMLDRLTARRGRKGIVGVNIGANKDSADRIADYEQGVKRFAPLASYLTVNISSPNTPGLRKMQAREILGELLARLVAARNEASPQGSPVPLFLKIAPDLDEAELDDIATELLDKRIDGVIISNTTLSRASVSSLPNAKQAGGLSGRPLFERSTIMLARMRKRLGPTFPIIGVGGVDSTDTAIEKIRAGADLVQLYTGMIYAGPSLPGRIVEAMGRFVRGEKLRSITEIRDSHLSTWADRNPPA